MAITINGTGTITGVTVGGLPDSIVDTDMLAANAVTAPKIGTNTFTSYAIICDEKPQGTAGGTFTESAWRTRDLNTEISDTDGIVSISDNDFTVQAGTYLIRASAPAKKATVHQIALFDVTNSTTIQYGTNELAHITYLGSTRSFLTAKFTTAAAKTLRIRHFSSHTVATEGFGGAFNATDTSDSGSGDGIYTIVEIYKEA